jgi:hypothetical protein
MVRMKSDWLLDSAARIANSDRAETASLGYRPAACGAETCNLMPVRQRFRDSLIERYLSHRRDGSPDHARGLQTHVDGDYHPGRDAQIGVYEHSTIAQPVTQ